MTRECAASSRGSGSVLVTGGSGIVGSEVVELLRHRGWREVVTVCRRPARGSHEVVSWDIGKERPPAQLLRRWDVIVNAAADTRWTMSATEAHEANVTTVEALQSVIGDGTYVVHVSTAYAVGLKNDVSSIKLEDYRNTYEWSKACAERLVREAFPYAAIVRPTLVIGRRSDGHVARFAGVYTLLRGIAASTIPAVVSTPSSYLDVVPVDDLAGIIADTAGGWGDHNGVEVLTVAAGRTAPRVEEAVTMMVLALNAWRRERGCVPHDPPSIVSPDSWERFFLPFVRQHLSPRQRQIIELLRHYEPYLQITKPIEPTHEISDVAPCLPRSVCYWAGANERLARLPARPWIMDKRQGLGRRR